MEKDLKKYHRLSAHNDKSMRDKSAVIAEAIRQSDNKDNVHAEWLAENIVKHLEKSGHHLVCKDDWASGYLEKIKGMNKRLLILEGQLDE